uniref:Putative secreted protein n=1 Tax=Ixodes ricinus TaxID=34613 RepID=V5HZF1_IXORI
MGNLAIVLLLVCIVSSCVAFPGWSCQDNFDCLPGAICDNSSCKVVPCKDNSDCPGIVNCHLGNCWDKAVPIDYPLPNLDEVLPCHILSDNPGQPCKMDADCCYALVCKSGSCQRR